MIDISSCKEAIQNKKNEIAACFDACRQKNTEYVPTAETLANEQLLNAINGIPSGGGEDTQQLIDLIEGDITTLNIPNGTPKIRQYAFYYCSSLTSIIIPDSVTSIGSYAFYSSGLTNLTIPDSVITIGSNAFYMCNYLITATLGTGITEISNSLFNNCGSLNKITINGKIKKIGTYAFQWCNYLNNIELPDSLTTIGDSAFQYCQRFSKIIIPANVTNIGKNAFSGCSALTEMTILAQNPPTLSSTNAISTATTTIYIPSGTLSAYQTATNWSSFASKFVELNEDGSKPE